MGSEMCIRDRNRERRHTFLYFFYLCRRRQNTPDMKRLFIFSTFLLCLLSTTFSQQSDNTIKPNLKYGKPSKEELTMTSFAPDTTATAYADIQIPYYSNGRNPTLKENVSQLALFLDVSTIVVPATVKNPRIIPAQAPAFVVFFE